MNTTLANNSHPDSCPALVLNADYQPLSYYPLSLWSWQDAIKAVYLDRVNIVSTYDLKSKITKYGLKFHLLYLLKIISNHQNGQHLQDLMFLRDKFMCQYCGSKEDLTFESFCSKIKRRTYHME